MKPTKTQTKKLRKALLKEDWEVVHCEYDDLVYRRLKELDPEFIKVLDQLTEDAEFWYA